MSAVDRDDLKIFAGRSGVKLAETMCGHLNIPLAAANTELFPDGEVIVKIEEDVRGRDCFVVQPTCDPVNANLMELLIYIDCLKRASARRITAVVPYFGYARQDRKDEGRTPITAKLVANLITAAGADRLLCMDLHAAQIQGFFDIPVDHLSASKVIGNYLQSIRSELGDIVLVSPDVGNVKVATNYATLLNAELAIIDKRRVSGMNVTSNHLIGDTSGRTVIMVDDMVSTAGTVCEAARVVMENGARDVIVAATHAVMVGLAMERLNEAPISRVIVTDTIPDDDGRLDPIRPMLTQLTVANLLGEAIYRIHHDMSISALFREINRSKRVAAAEAAGSSQTRTTS
ncbi:MAG: ribose-phosphate pyrophosphokinase [Phycisphaerales bacterium]|nr:ribose-phosphate pyrophosphokinase [Phycisphaerales bacterium]